MPDDDPKLKALQEKQQQIMLLMSQAQVEGEPDVPRLTALAELLQGEAGELEAMAAAYVETSATKPRRGFTEVVLTDGQRKRIEEKTGVRLESVFINDDAGIMAKVMPHTKTQAIERIAMREAERRAAAVEAQAQIQAELSMILPQLEVTLDGNPEAMAQLEAIKTDPNFVGNQGK